MINVANDKKKKKIRGGGRRRKATDIDWLLLYGKLRMKENSVEEIKVV